MDALKRLKPDQRHWYPPTKEKFAELVESIRSQKKSHSKATAMAVEFLAFTGMRISEAQSVTWDDVRDGHIVRRIAKNDGFGKIPLIPATLALLERMKVTGLPCFRIPLEGQFVHSDPIYLLAWCRSRDAPRNFRLGRIGNRHLAPIPSSGCSP